MNKNEIDFIKVINGNNLIEIKKVLNEIVKDYDIIDFFNIFLQKKYDNFRFDKIYVHIKTKKYYYFFKAFGEFRNSKYVECINILKNNKLDESNYFIGLSYYYLKKNDKAIEYFKKSKYSMSKYRIYGIMYFNKNKKLNRCVKYYIYYNYHKEILRMLYFLYLNKKYKNIKKKKIRKVY